jgi:hypothetical protein
VAVAEAPHAAESPITAHTSAAINRRLIDSNRRTPGRRSCLATGGPDGALEKARAERVSWGLVES